LPTTKRAASALNHPHICTIYEVGEGDGHAFIAMELLEGETPRQCLSRGAFKTDDLLEVAIQLADGLDAAHAKGGPGGRLVAHNGSSVNWLAG
jgi:serine/threonine protein kinase